MEELKELKGLPYSLVLLKQRIIKETYHYLKLPSSSILSSSSKTNRRLVVNITMNQKIRLPYSLVLLKQNWRVHRLRVEKNRTTSILSSSSKTILRRS